MLKVGDRVRRSKTFIDYGLSNRSRQELGTVEDIVHNKRPEVIVKWDGWQRIPYGCWELEKVND
jgi:hypothetical protein